MYKLNIELTAKSTIFSMQIPFRLYKIGEFYVEYKSKDKDTPLEMGNHVERNGRYCVMWEINNTKSKRQNINRAEFKMNYDDIPDKVATIAVAKFENNEWRVNDNFIAIPNRMIGFSLTNMCNLRCKMCWQDIEKPPQYLPAQAVDDILNSIKPLVNPPVYLWGGEPLLHPDVWKIVRSVKKKNLFCIVNTNGVMIENCIDEIFDSGLDMCVVSIDGREDIHDKIRGREGTYQRVLRGLKKLCDQKKLRGRKPIIVINCVITDLNYLLLEELVKLKEEIEADYLEFQFLMFFSNKEKEMFKHQFKQKFGFLPESADSYPDSFGDVYLPAFRKILFKIRRNSGDNVSLFPYELNNIERVDDYFEEPNKLHRSYCANIHKSFWVESNGDVYPCSNFTDYCVGNILEQDFYDIWNGQKFVQFREEMNKDLFSICSRCCDMYKTNMFQRRGQA